MYFYCWLASLFLWVLFIVGFYEEMEEGNFERAYMFATLQTFMLIPIWVFAILGW